MLQEEPNKKWSYEYLTFPFAVLKWRDVYSLIGLGQMLLRKTISGMKVLETGSHIHLQVTSDFQPPVHPYTQGK